MRSVAVVAIGAALLVPACKERQICDLPPQPAVLVDLRAFVAAHSDVSGSLCSRVGAEPSAYRPCRHFTFTNGGLLGSSTGPIVRGPRPGELSDYVPVGDDVLVVQLHASGTPTAGGRVQLITHQQGPCSVRVYSPVVVSADGTPSTR